MKTPTEEVPFLYHFLEASRLKTISRLTKCLALWVTVRSWAKSNWLKQPLPSTLMAIDMWVWFKAYSVGLLLVNISLFKMESLAGMGWDKSISNSHWWAIVVCKPVKTYCLTFTLITDITFIVDAVMCHLDLSSGVQYVAPRWLEIFLAVSGRFSGLETSCCMWKALHALG